MTFIPLLMLALIGPAQFHSQNHPFTSLFDGKSLKGWVGRADVFRVESGAIVGGSMERGLPNNEFLTSSRSFKDFELLLEFKVIGKGANAGIQILSQRIPNNHEMIGFQADLGDGYWGALYDESRRNRVLAMPESKVIETVLKRDDWNEYRIVCEGKRIRLWINGRPTVDYVETDPNIPLEGKIGLQIHGGPPSIARYRKIRIRSLIPIEPYFGDPP